MELNNFTDNEAIEICISIRDNLALDYELDLQDRWREKDALALLINKFKKYREKYGEIEDD